MMIARPALRYFGGKWKLSDWIIEQFPPHICYVEPYGGAASVLLRKPAAFLTVYNDIGSLVVNFFRVLREQPGELIRLIELTPYSREEYLLSQEPSDDPLESARRFYTWCWQGRGRGGVKEPGGWRFMKSDSRGQTPVDDWSKTDYLYEVAARFRNVQIEHDDALKIIHRYDGPRTLFYLDPPYVHDSRGDRWNQSAYHHEMSDQEHSKLAEVLRHIQGMAVVSGYPNDLYDTLFYDWRRVEKRAYKERNTPTTECLWMNFQETRKLF